MKRRMFLREIPAKALAVASAMTLFRSVPEHAATADKSPSWIDPAKAQEWRVRWEDFILKDSAKNRYCDTEMAEELGWLVSPFLDGFYYGYLATHDTRWIERLIDWADSCIRRAVKEPDGYLGWPKVSDQTEGFDYDSILGEAMMLRPMVLMAGEVLKTPALETKWGGKARSYLELAERTFEKWDSRDAWRGSRWAESGSFSTSGLTVPAAALRKDSRAESPKLFHILTTRKTSSPFG